MEYLGSIESIAEFANYFIRSNALPLRIAINIASQATTYNRSQLNTNLIQLPTMHNITKGSGTVLFTLTTNTMTMLQRYRYDSFNLHAQQEYFNYSATHREYIVIH